MAHAAYVVCPAIHVTVTVEVLTSSVDDWMHGMQEHAITSNEALSMPDLPKGPVVVVGAGYISLEFSGIYNGMGKDVHLFYRKSLPLVGYAVDASLPAILT